ncbi:hypothetical protein MY3296_003657 [Beauveria thailandica]
MGENVAPRQQGFAFNPGGLWGFRTALDRVPRRIIRVSSRKGLLLSTEAVAAWNDTSGAGLQFGLAETALNSEDCDYFAVVVGELVPEVARKASRRYYYHPERYEKPKDTDTGLRKTLKWITLENESSRCLVVRKISSRTNTFYVLAHKSTWGDGLCTLLAAPALQKCRPYIAFYDEWAESCEEKNVTLKFISIKRNLNTFCRRSLRKFRSSFTRPPILSQELVTPVSKETQIHSKGLPAQQTVTHLLEKQSQTDKRPSTIVTQTTKEASPKPLELQKQSNNASSSVPISSPLQTVLEPAEPGQQPESEASSNTLHTEPATTGLQNQAWIEQNNKRRQTVQDSPVQNSKGCQTLQQSTVQSEASEMTQMDTCLARLFTLDDEYTASNALELVGEMKVINLPALKLDLD